ncbi:MAG: polysaccharide biosynthesis C-terminal domain-containing protein, partial [Acidobacteriota bacterium]
PLILLGAVAGVLAAFLQGFLAVKERAWIENVIVTGLTAGALALCWALGWGWPGVVAAMLAGPTAGIACAAALLSRLSPGVLRSRESGHPLPAGPLLAYSWPLLGTSMLGFLLMWSDILLMGFLRQASEVGVYGLCARLVTGVLLFHESIGQVFIPKLSDLFDAADRDGMRRLYHLSSRWAVWPALVVAWMLILWGRELLALFGPDFARGAAPLAVLAAAKAIAACAGMSGRVFAVTEQARLNLVNLLLMVTSNIVLNLLWIPRYGALGAAAATCVSLGGIKILQVVQVGVLFRLLPWDRRSLVPIGGITALALGMAAFRDGLGGSWGWLVPLSTFIVACLALFLFWGVADDERDVWRAARGRLRSTAES